MPTGAAGNRPDDVRGARSRRCAPRRYPATCLYDNFGGFQTCVIAITVVYALILPTLLLVPPKLIATADGEPQLVP